MRPFLFQCGLFIAARYGGRKATRGVAAKSPAPVKLSFIRLAQTLAMQVEKRSMNWLPRASLYGEAEAARAKRKAYSQSALAQNASFNNALIGTANTGSTGEQINLTLRIAAQRIQEQASAKLAKAQEGLNLVA